MTRVLLSKIAAQITVNHHVLCLLDMFGATVLAFFLFSPWWLVVNQCLKCHFSWFLFLFLHDKSCLFIVFTYIFQTFFRLLISCLHFFFSRSYSLPLSPVLWIFLFPLKTPFLSATAVSPPVWLCLEFPHVYVLKHLFPLTFCPVSGDVRFFPCTGRHSTGHRRCLCLLIDGSYTDLPFVYCCASRGVCYDRDEFVSGLEIWLEI